MKERVRVLVVDDSALMRKLIPLILERDPDIEVVGTAMDGNFALRKIAELQPDLITLDLEMPRMDGLETLRMIMRGAPLPVIVFSSHSKQGAYATFKALALGAIDFVAKPENAAAGNLETVASQLVEKIKVAKRAGGPKALPRPQGELSIQSKKRSRPALPPTRIIAIGISTGGPNALQYTLSQFSADFPAAFIVVQHMPEGFTEMFARRLDECCAMDIQEAKSGDLLVAGRVLICPGNRHILARRMPRGEMVVLSDTAPINGHRPSADILFHSVAQEFGPISVGLIMTGMGEDGAEGLGAIKAAGGLTIAQSEESCVVSGMPRAAIQRGHASKILALEALAPYLIYQFGNDRNNQDKSESPERSEKTEKTDKNEKPERSPVSTPGA
jgi:two-component system chemotaxis response regulator CheB